MHNPGCSVAITCPAIAIPRDNDGDATWPLTNAGDDDVIGACPPGYNGIPMRKCSAVSGVGVWQAPDSVCIGITNAPNARFLLPASEANAVRQRIAAAACLHLPAGYCDFVDDTNTTGINATFDVTKAGSYAVGTCAEGLFGRPVRLCQSDLTWSDEVLNLCARMSLPKAFARTLA